MADFTETTTVDAPTEVLFAYLADVGHLPDYFDRMTSAAPGEGDEVHTTATLPDGRQVEGDAWFKVDRARQRIEWGSEGPSGYRGRLEVRPAGEASEVEVSLHTTRVGDGDDQVTKGLATTLATIKARVEAG